MSERVAASTSTRVATASCFGNSDVNSCTRSHNTGQAVQCSVGFSISCGSFEGQDKKHLSERAIRIRSSPTTWTDGLGVCHLHPADRDRDRTDRPYSVVQSLTHPTPCPDCWSLTPCEGSCCCPRVRASDDFLCSADCRGRAVVTDKFFSHPLFCSRSGSHRASERAVGRSVGECGECNS